jgi:small subunit ribosomal protein S15
MPKAKTTTAVESTLSASVQGLQRHAQDNGSPEVQIALLSQEIKVLQDHVNTNIHDVDAKRSLLRKVAKRRMLLKYLKEKSLERYTITIQQLGLKG